jgi:hypothetical protein
MFIPVSDQPPQFEKLPKKRDTKKLFSFSINMRNAARRDPP